MPPEPSPWILPWFTGLARRRLRATFHRLRVTRDAFDVTSLSPDKPLVIFANHAAWWDPLVALTVRSILFPSRTPYAPIDAAMLEEYAIFKRLGFFGVDRSTQAGGRRFIATASKLLDRPEVAMFITPQGRLADPRERPVQLERGLSLLARRCPDAAFVPFATEFPFWEESKPEVLFHIGEPVNVPESRDAATSHDAFVDALTRAQDHLAALAIHRQPSDFRLILEGSYGVGGFYDLWRRLRAWVQGKSPRLHHGDL